MPTYQALLPDKIYPFLNRMSELYSAVEKDMHVALIRGDSLAVIEKSLQAKYQVDSTTTRNVYHNLKGKHQGIKELRKTQAKDLKSTIKSIQSDIKKRSKKKQLTQKDRLIIHQKKRRLAIKQQKLDTMLNGCLPLCFGTKKLFKAQFNLEANGYSSHDEWLKDWRTARTSNFMMVGSKTYASGNQLCRLKSDGELKITVPISLVKEFGGHIVCESVKFNYGQTFIDIALTPARHKRGDSYRNGTERAVTHRCVRKNGQWYLHTTVELPDIPWISSKKNRLRENGKLYAKMLSSFAYSKFADLVQSKAQLKAIQVISVNPAYSSLIGMVKYMSLYGLNSGTAASLVLARRSFRFSERLPRLCNALFAPVDVNKHVWSYWARISKLVKGCRRHSFFGMRVKVGVKSDSQCLEIERKLSDKFNDTSKIPSESPCLDSRLHKFTQLCLDFK